MDIPSFPSMVSQLKVLANDPVMQHATFPLAEFKATSFSMVVPDAIDPRLTTASSSYSKSAVNGSAATVPTPKPSAEASIAVANNQQQSSGQQRLLSVPPPDISAIIRSSQSDIQTKLVALKPVEPDKTPPVVTLLGEREMNVVVFNEYQVRIPRWM